MGKRGPPALPLEDTGEVYRGFKKQIRQSRNGWSVTKYTWTADSNSPDPGKALAGMKAVDRHLEPPPPIPGPESGQQVRSYEEATLGLCLVCIRVLDN